MEKRGQGPAAVRKLLDPGALLDSWADAHSLKEYTFRAHPGWSQSPNSLRSAVVAALDLRQIPYALTLTSGAGRIALFVTGSERLTILVQEHPALNHATDFAGALRQWMLVRTLPCWSHANAHRSSSGKPVVRSRSPAPSRSIWISGPRRSAERNRPGICAPNAGTTKDAYDLIYCLRYYQQGPPSVVGAFAHALDTLLGEPLLAAAVEILRQHFATDDRALGYRKEGPTLYARFSADPGRSNLDARNRRDATATVELFLQHLLRPRPDLTAV